MPTFRYASLNQPSGPVATLDAPDRASALRELMSRGITPRSLEQVGAASSSSSSSSLTTAPASNGGSARKASPANASGSNGAANANGVRSAASASTPKAGGFFARRAMNLTETASFIRELATAVQAGLPLVPALRTLARAGRTPAQQVMLAHLIERVEQGKPLAEAMRTWGKPFGDLVVNLVKAGESSGRLPETLHQCADLLERDLYLRRMIMSATLYPIILLVLVSAAVAVVTTVIVPKVLKPLEGRNIELPLPTRLVQGFAWFMGSYWWLVLLLVAGAVFAWVRLRQIPSTRLQIDAMLLKLPLFGLMIRDAAVARFTRTLGTLVRAGLPVLTALRLTAATMSNTAMRAAIGRVCDEVQGGKTIATPLEREGIFPPLLVQIVSLGERSGKLPDLLNQAAGSLDSRTETRVKVVSGLLPPILVVGVAIIVGIVVAAILLPLLQLQDEAGRF